MNKIEGILSDSVIDVIRDLGFEAKECRNLIETELVYRKFRGVDTLARAIISLMNFRGEEDIAGELYLNYKDARRDFLVALNEVQKPMKHHF